MLNENYLKRVCIIYRTINKYLTKLFSSVRENGYAIEDVKNGLNCYKSKKEF